jgi:hypothetical protein
MSQPPVSDEIAAALARFYHGGAGPSHSKLTTAFVGAGYGDVAPYDPGDVSSPNKETRVLRTVRAAMRRPDGARRLIQRLARSGDRTGRCPYSFSSPRPRAVIPEREAL